MGVYQDTMHQLFALGLKVNPDEREPFVMRMKAYSSPWLRFASFYFSPHTTTRRVVANRNQQTYFLVSLQERGRTCVVQDDRETIIEAGDVFLVDTGRPFSFRSGGIHTRSLYIPTHELRKVFAPVDALTAVRIRQGSPAGRMLRGMIDELFELAPLLDEEGEAQIASATPHVLAVALSSILHTADAIPPRIERYHKDRIRRFIREHLADLDLDAGKIANAMGLSARRIHSLFANEPVSLMRSIWHERLERCREALAQPSLRHQRIGDIAGSWGFRDFGHFSNSFRRRYSMTPREFRRQALDSPAAEASGKE